MSAPAGDALVLDEQVLGDALREAAARCGRLSDDQLRALRRRRRTVTRAAGGVLGAAGALWLAAPAWRSAVAPPPAAWSRTLATRAGERGTLTLTDGSTVRLNGATRVRVTYRAGVRRAELLAGQAFFDVRHDAARPFTVVAGRTSARVLGTAFDLDLTRRQVALSVYRGAVGFDPAGTRGVVVRAGYRSSIAAGVASAPTRFDANSPDWRAGWVDTDGMRLDDLVEVLDRAGANVAVPREPLASTRVFGRFRTDRPRALLGAIGAGFGFAVAEHDGELVLEPH
ncbi:FecR domain-containing protein [Sphingomonas sp. BK580]|uniref:FecR family protein n=1 Tax=Sphingomonas sp. BK580 TaxID=2586972 RepID=UPI0016112CFE|nr:FecR domain-containing protein [Sphingomonas sp. BK580]MBB3695668.1 transmembrane sensor [Sphingomonas sp. BK580]